MRKDNNFAQLQGLKQLANFIHLGQACINLPKEDTAQLHKLPRDVLVRLVAEISQSISDASGNAHELEKIDKVSTAVDAIIADAAVFDHSDLLSSEDLRVDLVEQLRSGSRAELDAVQVAAFNGHLDQYLKSRKEPGYKEALASINAVNAKRNSEMNEEILRANVALAQRDIQAANGAVAAIYEILEKQKKELSMPHSKRLLLKRCFGGNLQSCLEYYWLPLKLWDASHKEAQNILQKTSAALLVQIIQSESVPPDLQKMLKEWGLDADTFDPSNLLGSLRRNMGGFSATAYNTARSRIVNAAR